MNQPPSPSPAFWRSWLFISARIFTRIVLCLCVAWSVFACLLPLFAPPPVPRQLSSGPALDAVPARLAE